MPSQSPPFGHSPSSGMDSRPTAVAPAHQKPHHPRRRGCLPPASTQHQASPVMCVFRYFALNGERTALTSSPRLPRGTNSRTKPRGACLNTREGDKPDIDASKTDGAGTVSDRTGSPPITHNPLDLTLRLT